MVSKYGSDKTDDLAALRGKRFVCAQEGESGQKLAEAKIKLMTGGDTITCRPLYGNLSTFAPQFKLWLATNQLPAISGTDVAIWRRINVIEFPVTISAEKRDPNLQAALLTELPGILNWALDGLAAWEREGLNPPEQVVYATDKYRSDNDTVGQFICDACARDPNASEMTKALHARYLEWCENSGLEALALASFGKQLGRLGLKPVKTSAGNGWTGIKLPVDDIISNPF
jgi:putative DNA primase/helicase